MRSHALLAALCGGVIAGCDASAPSSPSEATGRTAQPILGGTPSGDPDNASVFVVTTAKDAVLRCTGTLVAPSLVLTARHCLLRMKNAALPCTADGDLVDPADARGQDVRLEAAQNVAVYFGSDRDSWEVAHGAELLAPPEVSLCRNDVAFIVLDRPLAPLYTALRTTTVRTGERMTVSGWGFTADGQTELPRARSTLTDVRIEEVGPGTIPAATFAIAGATTCFGDSGAGALIAGAVAGVYSRIEGGACSLREGRNVFMMLAPHRKFIERAFLAAGQTPWFEGEPSPSLVETGQRCSSDASCRSQRCLPAGLCAAADASRRAAPACEGGTCSTRPGESAASPASAGCAAGRGLSTDGSRALDAALVTLLGLLTMRRGRRQSVASETGRA